MKRLLFLITCFSFLIACREKAGNEGMAKLLASIDATEQSPANQFCAAAKIKYYDSIIKVSTSNIDLFTNTYYKANALLENGNEQAAIETLEALLQKMQVYNNASMTIDMQKLLALAYLRLGERTNCLHNHSAASCIFPIANSGVHVNKTGSYKAIELYQNILQSDPNDLESLWLLNIAYMTVGGYPNSVPPRFLLKGLDAKDSVSVSPFMDIAANTGLSINNMGGGTVIDDFNNDGYLDLITSGWGLQEGMHYFINNADGTFRDVSDSSELSKIKGGLNIMQTDYNNDGLKDVFVLRGAWKSKFGKEPPSLLRNNGDGTFTDVTKESGLLSIHPTQTATWADFNNDGWLDVFIGHESWDDTDPQYCELYLNNHDGTFTNYTKEAGLNVAKFVKGVTSGDYDNDGDADIFISTLNGDKFLFQNEGVKEGKLHFKDVTNSAGFANEKAKTFATWFFDYDNDGWLDLIVCGYNFTSSLATYAAEEALGKPELNSGEVFLYRNNHDGSFTNITKSVGLTKMVFAMSANFGDIDNDGYSDMFFGTGNPKYQSLVPNKMFKNMGGKYFADVTNSARVGSLQKGHGISFADMDNDGDEDIYIDMGGAYPGDVYQNSFFINPGQGNNNWIDIATQGTSCNKVAIGARLMVYFKEENKPRVVYRDVNSGGSFGANPLRQHIGIGTATSIDSIVIKWPGDKASQTFRNILPNQFINILQGNNAFTTTKLKTLDFTKAKFNMLVQECGK